MLLYCRLSRCRFVECCKLVSFLGIVRMKGLLFFLCLIVVVIMKLLLCRLVIYGR